MLTTVAKKSELLPGKAIAKSFNNVPIAIFNIDGKIYAIDDACTHAGGSLAEGEINGMTVTCPWHGATFDIANGSATGAPAFEAVKGYKVVVEGDEVKIEA